MCCIMSSGSLVGGRLARPRRHAELRSGRVVQRALAGAATKREGFDFQPQQPAGHVWYWSYGANMSPEVLRKRGVQAAAEALAVAPPDAVLSFQHRGGFATIEIDDGAGGSTIKTAEEAFAQQGAGGGRTMRRGTAGAGAAACRIRQPHGVLMLLKEAQLATLARTETGYSLTSMELLPYGSPQPVEAQLFVSQRMLRLAQAVPPTQRYLHLLVSGAKACGLSEPYVEQLTTVPAARPGGLPAEYFDTPSTKFALAAALLVLATVLFLLVGPH